jgi:polyisoprenoid-binding protein YceI
MKKLILTTSFVILGLTAISQSLYICRTGEASFFSKAPLEDIEAHNRNTTSILNTSNGEIAFTVPIKAFKFEKDLMQEHFNEKYMESDKFPEATFKGKINEKVDYSKNGIYNVTSTGKLKIHGVEKDRTEKGTLTVKDGNITLQCNLKITLKDFNITIPKLVFENIAETVDVKINAPYVLFKK